MKRPTLDRLILIRGKWLAGGAVLLLLGLLAWQITTSTRTVAAASVDASSLAVPPAAPEIFASPVHAGCYLVRADRCKIHVEPFTIDLAPGRKLVLFRLVAIRMGTGAQTTIYDFRPDQSNPAPAIGSTYTPSLVAKDFGATCGQSYEINLQGKDTGDATLFSLGLTDQFTCPKGTFQVYTPLIRK